MSKIFGIGLMRTGTTSLCEAMKILGYSSVHYTIYPDYDVHYNEFICDMPMQTRYEKYDRRYPGSKFILTTRNLESWLESCKRWCGRKSFIRSSITNRYRLEQFGIDVFDRDIFINTYNNHYNKTINYFNNRKTDLLIIDICYNPSWKKLCEFLNKAPPNLPFPHLNKNE